MEENLGGSMADGLSFNRTFWSFYGAIFSENYGRRIICIFIFFFFFLFRFLIQIRFSQRYYLRWDWLWGRIQCYISIFMEKITVQLGDSTTLRIYVFMYLCMSFFNHLKMLSKLCGNIYIYIYI